MTAFKSVILRPPLDINARLHILFPSIVSKCKSQYFFELQIKN